MEKLQVICSQLDYTPDFGARLFQSFTPLFRFRDRMVHGSSEHVEHDETTRYSGKWEVPESKWESECTLSNAQRDVSDTRAMIEAFNQRLGEKAVPIGLLGIGTTMVPIDE